MPTILRKGPAWFAGLGPANSGGTMIYSMSGHVERPRNIELPLGVPFADLLEMCGGMKGGRKIKAVIPGGVSVPVVPGDIMMKTNMDYDSVKAAGSALVATKSCMVIPLFKFIFIALNTDLNLFANAVPPPSCPAKFSPMAMF